VENGTNTDVEHNVTCLPPFISVQTLFSHYIVVFVNLCL